MEEYDIEVKANTSSFAGLVSDNFKKVNLFKYIKKVFDYLKTTPGTVLKDTMIGVDDIIIISDIIAETNSFVVFLIYDYTPISSSSYLLVHLHIGKHNNQGITSDIWNSQLLVDGDEIGIGYQATTENNSFRTSTLFPIDGRFTNNSTITKQIQVAARLESGDDFIKVDTVTNSIYLRITEIAR